MDLALNNQQWLICHKNKPNQTKPSTLRCMVSLHLSLIDSSIISEEKSNILSFYVSNSENPFPSLGYIW